MSPVRFSACSTRAADSCRSVGVRFSFRVARRVLRTLALDPAKRLAMAEAARTLAKPNAAAQVVDIVLQTVVSQEKRA